MQINVPDYIFERIEDYCSQYQLEQDEFVEELLDSLLPKPQYAIQEGNNWYVNGYFSFDPRKALLMDKETAVKKVLETGGKVVKVYD